MRIITALNTIEKSKLKEFIDNHNSASFFQSIIAYELFESLQAYDPLFIIAANEDDILGSLLAVFITDGQGIKARMSRRCIIWGGPLIKGNNSKVANLLLKKLSGFAKKKAIYTEFRNLYDMDIYKTIFKQNGFEYREHLNFIVKVETPEQAKAKLSRSKKRQINKTIKQGAKIIEPESLGQVKEFYEILKKLYREKVGKPIADFELFEKFFENKSLGNYLFIEYNKKIIGGIMCPIYKDTIYEWYVCGLDGEFDNIYSSVVATWAPIEYAAQKGLKYFDFMGAGRPNDDYGVREFKSKFGGELKHFGRFLKVNKPVLYTLGKSAISIKKALKI